MEKYEMGIRPDEMVGSLSVAKQQMLEIVKALSEDAKILVMDEPTSSLTLQEVEHLFRIIKQLTANGVTIIYISHRLSEIFEIADNAMVMRDGKKVARVSVAQTNTDELVAYMVGREIKDMYPKRVTRAGRDILRVQNLCTDFLKGVSFSVREGEVVGLFGLMGAGRTEVAECIVGCRKYTGEMEIDGKAYDPRSPLDSLRNGVAYVPAERKSEGVCLISPVRDNVTIANLKKFAPRGIMHLKQERQIAQEWVGKLGVKTPSIMTEIDSLSGGNQQKVVVAKGLNTEPKLMILNEPTRGIDVGAKVEIYNLINDLCADNKAVVMISSELPEIMSMADRIVVLHEGMVTAQIDKAEFSQELLLKYAIGG